MPCRGAGGRLCHKRIDRGVGVSAGGSGSAVFVAAGYAGVVAGIAFGVVCDRGGGAVGYLGVS